MHIRFSNSTATVAVISAAALLSACSTSAPIANIARIAPESIESNDTTAARNEQLQSVLRVDDRISISVAREPSLSLEGVRIANDGSVDVPYIGRLAVAGHTSQDIAAQIELRLRREYLSDPHVSVNIVEYASHTVIVEGAVGHPGQFTYNKGTTLLGAIANSGGPTRVAKLDQVAIYRTSTGERQVAVFDLKQVRSGKQPDPLLEPGDQVIVGYSGMKQGWQDLLQTAPLFAIFYRL